MQDGGRKVSDTEKCEQDSAEPSLDEDTKG